MLVLVLELLQLVLQQAIVPPQVPLLIQAQLELPLLELLPLAILQLQEFIHPIPKLHLLLLELLQLHLLQLLGLLIGLGIY